MMECVRRHTTAAPNSPRSSAIHNNGRHGSCTRDKIRRQWLGCWDDGHVPRRCGNVARLQGLDDTQLSLQVSLKV